MLWDTCTNDKECYYNTNCKELLPPDTLHVYYSTVQPNTFWWSPLVMNWCNIVNRDCKALGIGGCSSRCPSWCNPPHLSGLVQSLAALKAGKLTTLLRESHRTAYRPST